MSEPAVVFDNVEARRGGRTIWSEASFALETGSITAVLGPSGAGKTTLLRLIMGLLVPAAGRIEVLGSTPSRGNPSIGYVPQQHEHAAPDAIACRDAVTLARGGMPWRGRERRASVRAEVDEALAAVGADEFADSRMSELSGGQLQRVALARALVSRPDLVLLDEPLSNLDLRNQHDVIGLLGRLRDEHELTMVVVTHELNPLFDLATGAVCLLERHPHHVPMAQIEDGHLLSAMYGVDVQIVRTPLGTFVTSSHS